MLCLHRAADWHQQLINNKKKTSCPCTSNFLSLTGVQIATDKYNIYVAFLERFACLSIPTDQLTKHLQWLKDNLLVWEFFKLVPKKTYRWNSRFELNSPKLQHDPTMPTCIGLVALHLICETVHRLQRDCGTGFNCGLCYVGSITGEHMQHAAGQTRRKKTTNGTEKLANEWLTPNRYNNGGPVQQQ